MLNEIGLWLAPEPVVHNALTPGALIAELVHDPQRQLLDEVAASQKLLTLAYLETGYRKSTDDIASHAVQKCYSWKFREAKNPILAYDCTDTLVVSAALPDGCIGLFLVSGSAVIDIPSQCSTVSAVPSSN
ncbi:hypothetical protein ABFA25_13435 [Mycobacterium lepromatosis]